MSTPTKGVSMTTKAAPLRADYYYRAKEVADFMGVSKTTVLGLVRAGRLEGRRVGINPWSQKPRVCIKGEDVLDFLERCRVSRGPEPERLPEREAGLRAVGR